MEGGSPEGRKRELSQGLVQHSIGADEHRVAQPRIGRQRFGEVVRGFARAVGPGELEARVEGRHGRTRISHCGEVADGRRSGGELLHDVCSALFERVEHGSPARRERGAGNVQAHDLNVGSPAPEPPRHGLKPFSATGLEVQGGVGKLAKPALAQTLAAPSVLPEMIAPLKEPLCSRPGGGLPRWAVEAVLAEDAGHESCCAVGHGRMRDVEAKLGLQEGEEPLRAEPIDPCDSVSLSPGARPRAEIEVGVEEDAQD